MEQPGGVPEQDAPIETYVLLGDVGQPRWQSIGKRLRSAREAAGLTLTEVAEQTKVRPGILSDIEEDAHDRLPALTYALGFVKAYARTVGVDPAEAARAYRLESTKPDPVPSMVDLQPLEARRLPSRGLVFLSALVVLLALGGFWAWGAGWLTPKSTPAVESLPVPEPTPEEAADEAAAPALAAPQTSQVVTLAANKEVWLRISEGSEVFFTGILNPGQSLTLPEGRQWLLRTGRAGALDAKVGERAIPSFGGPIQQLYDVPLNPEALLARLSGAAPAPATTAPTPPVASAQPVTETPAADL